MTKEEYVEKTIRDYLNGELSLEKFVGEYFELTKGRTIEYSHLIQQINKLEKALDKACTELENLSYVKGVGQIGKNYSEWKEWCLKDDN